MDSRKVHEVKLQYVSTSIRGLSLNLMLIETTTKKNALHKTVLSSQTEIVSNVKVNGHSGNSYHRQMCLASKQNKIKKKKKRKKRKRTQM